MRALRSSLFASIVLVACVADAPLPVAAKPAASTATPHVVTPDAPVASVAADATPTVRTAAQTARDDARAPLAKAILAAYTNFAPKLSRDGTKLLFGSRRDGNREYYLGDVAHPAAAPLAITHGPERANGAKFTRDGDAILFTRDRGADENDRIYRVGLEKERDVPHARPRSKALAPDRTEAKSTARSSTRSAT